VSVEKREFSLLFLFALIITSCGKTLTAVRRSAAIEPLERLEDQELILAGTLNFER